MNEVAKHNHIVKLEQVPADLAELDRWLVWRYVDDRKIPYHIGGSRASTTNPAHWGTLESVHKILNTGRYNGLGFVFAHGDGLVGVDLDECFYEGTQNLKAWARNIVEQFYDTYIEVSPSGTGLKLWCRATLPRALKRSINTHDAPDGFIEMYSEGRYFTFTGMRFNSAPLEIVDCSFAVSALYEAFGPQAANRERPTYSRTFAPGTQHNELLRILGVLRRHNVCNEAIQACLMVVGEKQCQPPWISAAQKEHITRMVQSSDGWNADK